MKRIRAVIIAAVVIVGVACTPEEFSEFERTTGIDLTAEQQSSIAAQRARQQQCNDTKAYVNGLAGEHDYQDLDTAWTVVSSMARDCRGWEESTIAAWEKSLRAVMLRESAGCYNLRRGASFEYHDGRGCELRRVFDERGRFVGVDVGHGSDSGYGQVLMGVHRGWLCPQEHLCSPADVIASPANSATAFLALLERSGSQPWCFTKKLRQGSICKGMAGLPRPVKGM